MSYDVYMAADVGHADGPQEVGSTCHSMTSNVACMWHLAMENVGAPWTLKDIAYLQKEVTGAEASKWLTLAWRYMEEHAELFLPMEPPNGWGSFEGAKRFLHAVAKTCAEYPRALLYVSN